MTLLNQLYLDENGAPKCLKELYDTILELDNFLNGLVEKDNSVKDIVNYEKYRDALNAIKSKIIVLKQNFDEFPIKEYHLITMKSFLVCRCGGILEFATSGQERITSYKNSYLSLVTMMNDWVQYLNNPYQNFTREVIHSGQVIKQNARGFKSPLIHEILKYLSFAADVKMDLGSELSAYVELKDSEPLKAYIYVEFTSHAVYDERMKLYLTVLGILSAIPISGPAKLITTQNALSLGLIGLDIFQVVGSGDTSTLLPDGISGLAVADSTRNLNVPGISQANLFVTLLYNWEGFFYKSESDWIDNIRVTVILDNWIYSVSQKLDQNGKRMGNPIYGNPKCLVDVDSPLQNEFTRGNANFFVDRVALSAYSKDPNPTYKLSVKSHLDDYKDFENKKLDGIKKDVFGYNRDPCPDSCDGETAPVPPIRRKSYPLI